MESITEQSESNLTPRHIQFCKECKNGDLFYCRYNCTEIDEVCLECRKEEERIQSLVLMRDNEHRDHEYYVEQYKKEKALLDKRKNCYFVTITVSYEYDAQKYIDRVHKAAQSSTIKRCIYAFEWRHKETGNNKKIKGVNLNNNDGIHCHMWIDKYDKRKLNQHLKRLNKLKDWKVHIKKFNMKYKKDKFNYITGNTFEEAKNLKKILDIKKRKAYNLKNIYFKNEDTEYCDLCERVNKRQDNNLLTQQPLRNSSIDKVNTGIVVEF